MAPSIPQVRVRSKGARRFRTGHPWIFRDDVTRSGDAGHGDVVRVVTERGEPLRYAFFSAVSRIALRGIDCGEVPPDDSFWESRVAEAVALRRRCVDDTDAMRVLFGESDGLPGLIADLYGTHLVVQTLTAGAERILDPVLSAVREHIGISSVLLRNDPAVRALEGLPREVVQRWGVTPESIPVREGRVRYRVDPWRGQKTGAFLDQRENRIAAAGLARGRVLDTFSYHGSFALHAAIRGAEVDAVDSSTEAVARGEALARENGLTRVRFHPTNAFDHLRSEERGGARYAMIFLDPPAFAKSRADLPAARRGYKEINLRAMRILEAGGHLVSCSCSYNLREADFLEILAEAAADARRTFRIVERRGQSRDHPVRLGFPESAYLKCIVLEDADGKESAELQKGPPTDPGGTERPPAGSETVNVSG